MEKGVWGHRPVLEGGREGGGGGGPAIPILNRKFSHCHIFSPRHRQAHASVQCQYFRLHGATLSQRKLTDRARPGAISTASTQ